VIDRAAGPASGPNVGEWIAIYKVTGRARKPPRRMKEALQDKGVSNDSALERVYWFYRPDVTRTELPRKEKPAGGQPRR